MKGTNISRCLLLSFFVVVLASPVFCQEPALEKGMPAQDRKSYEKSMEERLGRLGAKLDELRKKAEAGTEKAGSTLRRELAEVEKKRREAAGKLEELGRASMDSWDKFSIDAEKAAREFEQAFDKAFGGND